MNKLAQGAGNFTGTISIGNGFVSYGFITINGNGEDFIYDNRAYFLYNVRGNLTLTVKDTTPPEAPGYTVNITAPTNQSVVITASYSNDSIQKQYCINNGAWRDYNAGTGIVMTGNGVVSMRGIDAAGNISDVTSYEVINIDKDVPTLELVADVTTPTNGSVVLTATPMK